MKKTLWAFALMLPLLAWPSQAKAFGFGQFEVDTGAKVWFNVRRGCSSFGFGGPGGQGGGFGGAGPWYLYYPYEAYFNVPAPGVSMYFPSQMTLPPNFYAPPPGAYAPPQPRPYGAPAPTQPAGLQRAGYWNGYGW